MRGQDVHAWDQQRARELIKLLPPDDPHRLGLYAVLRVMEEEASALGFSTMAAIVSMQVFESELEGRVPYRHCAYALKGGGKILGLRGEEGWAAVCDTLAVEHGLPQVFRALSFRLVQWAYAGLDWKEAERDEVEAEIQTRLTALKIAASAAQIDQATPPVSTPSPRRVL